MDNIIVRLIFSLFLIHNNNAFTYYSEVGMYYKVHTEKVSWNEAVKTCQSEGASLAMPKNKEEVDILLGLISSPFILLGFHNLFVLNKFTTLNSEDLQYYYSIWDSNQPNEGVGMCGYLNNQGRLHDGQCKQKFPFVCEKPTSSRREPNSDPNCLTSDTEYRYAPKIEKCYKIHMNPEKFATAEKICRSEGGHLAIIRDFKEEIFLSRMFNEPKYNGTNAVWPTIAFLGVHEMFELGSYMTVTNELFSNIDYAHWKLEMIRNPKEHCVSMNKGGFLDDSPCDVEGFFICEQPSIKVKKIFKTTRQIVCTDELNETLLT